MAKRPKQEQLKGLETEDIAELTEAVEGYEDVKEERMELTKREVDLKEKLISLMRQHKKKYYVTPSGYEAEYVPGPDNVKVRRRKDEAEEAAA